jgi:uncharacterized membrane protein YfcA
MTGILVALIVFLAAFLQCLAGFGFAVIAMPMVAVVVGLPTAAPLIAITGLTLYTVNLVRFRRSVKTREVLPLVAASVVGVPVGMWLLVNVDEAVVKQALGLILIAFGIYALAQPKRRRPLSKRRVYPTGIAAGCLGAAYNTPGPPAVVYGSLREWPKEEFRAAMQAIFFINATLVAVSHSIARHMTADVLWLLAYTVPALAVGILVGTHVDQRVNRDHFRVIVNLMILILGLFLILNL